MHISAKGLITHYFAPDINICNPVNHKTGEVEQGATKNAAVESAKLSRGTVLPLSECAACHYCALIIPGGLGVSRTLLALFDFHPSSKLLI